MPKYKVEVEVMVPNIPGFEKMCNKVMEENGFSALTAPAVMFLRATTCEVDADSVLDAAILVTEKFKATELEPTFVAVLDEVSDVVDGDTNG